MTDLLAHLATVIEKLDGSSRREKPSKTVDISRDGRGTPIPITVKKGSNPAETLETTVVVVVTVKKGHITEANLAPRANSTTVRRVSRSRVLSYFQKKLRLLRLVLRVPAGLAVSVTR